MPQATRDIKRRIKSIGNTKKITRAMEMVAAAKMRKAVSSVLSSRSYASLAWQLVYRLALKADAKYHPLLRKHSVVKKVGLVLITSNRGLCGGFNAQIIQKAVNYFKKKNGQAVAVELITLGAKGRDFMMKRHYALAADFLKAETNLAAAEIRPLAKLLINDYLSGKFDQIAIAYTDFISALVQKPRIMELLPLAAELGDSDLGQISGQQIEELPADLTLEYLFEPSPNQVLADLLPRMLEMEIYQAVLESTAAEHSARMVAMRNATEAAGDMINGLTLAFNKARQALITSELADISGGRAVVE